MLVRRVVRGALGAGIILTVVGCGGTPPTAVRTSVAEVESRTNRFPAYPVAGTTYLSFNRAHGFQVNYIAPQGRAWLWYPGNDRAVPEEWKTDTVRGIPAVCFRHPPGSFNPVTRRRDGAYTCQPLDLSQKTIVSSLEGDAFGLSSGEIPYRRSRCAAPEEFEFDRARFGC
ncbi:hypothetical protein RA2_03603 [Roseovarius sp. A-2]|uniref:hypothetical protein n=1 Tax=Roseovarius sp. A-2 TaxID=1570360 RepID=UPI0009B56ED2|nr:hypothetical protein [Roseovarius sp. A-2]GAW36531.1 hypothetical protein RA2_03603 [Roseovarius sp. A-2]